MLTLEELVAEVEAGTIDTVVCAFTDMQGRLVGKREQAEFFLDETVEHGLEGCNYLLALDMEMDPQPGYAMASWERGYGDFHLRPDLGTLRRIPWLEATALVLCDVAWEDGSPVVAVTAASAAGAGRARAARAASSAMFGSELEFYLFRESSYRGAREALPRPDPVGAVHPRLPRARDTYDEPLIRQIRNGMQAAGISRRELEGRGLAWPARDQLPLRGRADRRPTTTSSTRTARRRSPTRTGCSITFMAKPDHTWIGNSCHIHASLWRDGANAFAGGRRRSSSGFLAGLDRVRPRAGALPRAERQLVQALRRRELGADDARLGARQPDLRVPRSSGTALAARRDADPRRRRQPVPRLRGPDRRRPARDRAGARAPPPLEGNAYESEAERFPSTLREAIAALEQGTMARAAFGDEVVDHYLNYGRIEQRLFDEVVTCWERERLFERG